MQASRSEFLSVRQRQYHIRHWGKDDAPLLFMLHGWMDTSATFQFVVDHFKHEWHVIAPDWRGFGKSQWNEHTYWQPDYLADLETILDHYSPDNPVQLAGHSLGGYVGTLYAGVRPHRLAHFISMEGFGLMETQVEQARINYTRWLDEQKTPPVDRTYNNLEAVVRRFRKLNPRLSEAQTRFLAEHNAAKNAKGQWHILTDPKHRLINPIRFRLDEVLTICEHITAPVLLMESEYSLLRQRMGSKEKGIAELERRASHIPNVRIMEISDSGHMMQHDQPGQVAKTIEDFLMNPAHS